MLNLTLISLLHLYGARLDFRKNLGKKSWRAKKVLFQFYKWQLILNIFLNAIYLLIKKIEQLFHFYNYYTFLWFNFEQRTTFPPFYLKITFNLMWTILIAVWSEKKCEPNRTAIRWPSIRTDQRTAYPYQNRTVDICG